MHSSIAKLTCGTISQPWVIEAPIGQQISVNLLDFSSSNTNTNIFGSQQSCQQYGYILEKSGKKNVSICGFDQQRNVDVYKSNSKEIEVILNVANTYDNVNHQPRIIIGFHGMKRMKIVLILFKTNCKYIFGFVLSVSFIRQLF